MLVQPRPWLERSDPNRRKKVETRFYRDWSVATQNLSKWPGPIEKGRGCTNTKYDRYTLDHVIKFRIQNMYIETPHHVVVNFFNNTIQAEK